MICRSHETDSDTRELLRMRLLDFADSESWVRIRSELLGQDIILAGDCANDFPRGLPVYRVSEVEILMELGEWELKVLHMTKATFEGRIAAQAKIPKRRRFASLSGNASCSASTEPPSTKSRLKGAVGPEVQIPLFETFVN